MGRTNNRFWQICTARAVIALGVACLALLQQVPVAQAADHNDPNGINAIFSDNPVNPADLYDLFGFPVEDASGEHVVVALTFASIPGTGKFDPDLMYRVLFAPSPRLTSGASDDMTAEGMLKYFEALKNKYIALKPAEVRVTVDADGKATLKFFKFPGGDFTKTIDTNQAVTIETPSGQSVKAFVGGRDDAFFNDLPGFFRSINYAPQFYRVPHTLLNARELPIPKTLIELEGNTLFNFDPARPKHGITEKYDLPAPPYEWKGDKYFKDEQGNYRFVYSGTDAQAGFNVNAVILELPLSFVTTAPERDRVVNTWGESWVRKASDQAANIPDERQVVTPPFYLAYPWGIPLAVIAVGLLLLARAARSAANASRENARGWARPLVRGVVGGGFVVVGLAGGMIASMIAAQVPDLAIADKHRDDELQRYKLVDTDGQPFADAALNQREDDKQLGAFNFSLGLDFVTRLAHLGWGFGPSISALGLQTSFDHGNSPISVVKHPNLIESFPRARKVILQRLNMPDDSWKRKGVDVPLKRSIEIFIPNVCPIDMDTNGTWPYGRRLEDQVATRFLSLFLDMSATLNGAKYNIDTLGQQALWDSAPIEPKTPPNPLKNDKAFLDHFPYLADPW